MQFANLREIWGENPLGPSRKPARENSAQQQHKGGFKRFTANKELETFRGSPFDKTGNSVQQVQQQGHCPFCSAKAANHDMRRMACCLAAGLLFIVMLDVFVRLGRLYR